MSKRPLPLPVELMLGAAERRAADAKAEPLTVADLEAYYAYEHGDAADCADWGGYGYCGSRLQAMGTAASRAKVFEADAWIIANANANGWDVHTLHRFLNSKAGRWFAETATIAGFDLPRAVAEFSRIPRKDWDQA